MPDSMDWLSAQEFCERRAEEAESWVRRHRRGLMLFGAGVLMVVALCLYPSIHGRIAQSRPFLGVTPAARISVSREGAGPVPLRKSFRSARVAEHGQGSHPPGTEAPSGRTVQTDPADHHGRGPHRSGPDVSPSRTIQAGKVAAPMISTLPSGSERNVYAVSPTIPQGVTPSTCWMWVHVAGAVARPGVVRLPVGSRGFQAVRSAGGLLTTADLSRVNLARRLQDEAMLLIPQVGQAFASTDTTPEEAGKAGQTEEENNGRTTRRRGRSSRYRRGASTSRTPAVSTTRSAPETHPPP